MSDLLAWMNNSSISKITTKQFKHSGRGIAATESISSNHEIIRINHSYLLNSRSVIRHVCLYHQNPNKLPESYRNIDVPYRDPAPDKQVITIYTQICYEEMANMPSVQLVGLYICLEMNRKCSYWKPFLDLLPEMESFEMTPLVWEILQFKCYKEHINRLPGPVKKHAARIKQRFVTDYKAVTAFLASKLSSNESVDHYVTKELFLWVWMCINSRCLYMELAETKDKSDNFTLAPYVDFLNHSDSDHCKLVIDGRGFHVVTTSSYEPGDQLFLSYGAHANGFLLCEYGFILEENRWNEVDVSESILSRLSDIQKEFLNATGYYGDYTISKSSGVSYRTEIVLAVLQEETPKNSRKLNAYIKGISDGEGYVAGSKSILEDILVEMILEHQQYVDLERGHGHVQIEALIEKLHLDIIQIIEHTLETYIDK